MIIIITIIIIITTIIIIFVIIIIIIIIIITAIIIIIIIIVIIIIVTYNNNNNNNNKLVVNQVHNGITVQCKIPFRMDFLIFKRSREVSFIIRMRFSTKLHFKLTFYGKLILKICLDAKDWFPDKAVVQHKNPFQIDFLWKVNPYLDVKIGSTIESRFKTKLHFKWTFRNW